MKQYTTTEQTAKLIELGFEKPKFEIETQLCNIKGQPLRAATIVGDYSIGELIEFIGIGSLKIRRDTDDCWWVAYKNVATNKDNNTINSIWSADYELIDALYDMVIKLKEEGVI